jgi:hypothetical protein
MKRRHCQQRYQFSTLLALALATSFFHFSGSAIAFAPKSQSNPIQKRITSSTALFGTIRFKGKAQADLTAAIPPTLYENYATSNKTLSAFLLSSESDAILLGMKDDGGVAQVTQVDAQSSSSTWECRQSSIDWFGMTLIPIFTNVIERSEPLRDDEDGGSVIISIVEANTQVENGGRLGSALASAMRRSVFAGRNIVMWKEQEEEDDKSYTLIGDIELSLTITLPPFMPLPPGFNTIGSRIVERTCKERLRQNLRDVSDSYYDWALSQEK